MQSLECAVSFRYNEHRYTHALLYPDGNAQSYISPGIFIVGHLANQYQSILLGRLELLYGHPSL